MSKAVAKLVRSLHYSSMELNDIALIAQERGSKSEADIFEIFLTAAELERHAYELIVIPEADKHRPGTTMSKAILGRSAAWMYLSAKEYEKASDIVQSLMEDLDGMSVYSTLIEEILEVRDEVQKFVKH